MITLTWSLLVWADFKTIKNKESLKKKILTPFQTNLRSCLDKKIDLQQIDNYKDLYKVISEYYSLITSETIYREVMFLQNNVLKKLKYENDTLQIFEVLDDHVLKPIVNEQWSVVLKNNAPNHKKMNLDSYLEQQLFQAEIKSDYQKIKETRSQQVVLNMIWSDKQIKSMQLEFVGQNKSLHCTKKELADICSCRN